MSALKNAGKRYLNLLTGKGYRDASSKVDEAVKSGSRVVGSARRKAKSEAQYLKRLKDTLGERKKLGQKGYKQAHPIFGESSRWSFLTENLRQGKAIRKQRQKVVKSNKTLKDARRTRRSEVGGAKDAAQTEGYKTGATIAGTVAAPVYATNKYNEHKRNTSTRYYRYSAVGELMEFAKGDGSVSVDRGHLADLRKRAMASGEAGGGKNLTKKQRYLALLAGLFTGVGGTIGTQKLFAKEK